MSYSIPTATTTDLHFHLKCRHCGAQTPFQAAYVCEECYGPLEVSYDYAFLRDTLSQEHVGKGPRTLWRYRPLLPLPAKAAVPPLAVGGTPLYNAPRLAADLGLAQVWVKDDGRNPTGSLKDRASAVVVARAMAQGIEVVTTASTGNAAAALAGLSASVGLPAVIFVPASAPEAKIAQLLTYGAHVLLVQGNYALSPIHI